MIASYAIVFARAIGFVFRAPGFSHPSLPHVVRAALALFLTVAIAPSVREIRMTGVFFATALVTEFLIGSAIGTAAAVLYDGAYAGGRIIDDYVGVKAIAPSVALVAPSGFGRVWSIAFTGALFLSGGYRYVVECIGYSFTKLPPGTILNGLAWGHFAQALATSIVGVGAAIAAPSVALAFVMQIGLAALSRVIPRFSSFALAFPLVYGVVLLATCAAIPLAAGAAIHPMLSFPEPIR